MKNTLLTEEYILEQLDLIDPENNEDFKEVNDLNIARLFSLATFDYLNYCTDGSFYVFNGENWIKDNLEAEAVFKTFILALIKKTMNSPSTSELKKTALKMTSYGKMKSILNFCKSEKMSRVDFEEFDAEPYLLNCPNGVLNLKTGKLEEHSAEFKFTKITTAEYDPDMPEANRWAQFIDEITLHRKNLAEYLQKVLGYCLIGDKNKHKLWFLYGPKCRNGKSTLLSAVGSTLGSYATSSDTSTFAIKPFNNSSGPSDDIARLATARFVNLSEPDKSLRLNCALLKEFTGQDMLTARFLRQGSFNFRAQAALYWAVNSLPIIDDDSLFKSNRVIVIPFDACFLGKEDENLHNLFRSEIYQKIILKWLVDGCLKLREGLEEPECVKKATQAYAEKGDSVKMFFKNCVTKTDPSEKKWTTISVLYPAYTEFCKDSHLPPIGKMSFTQELKEKIGIEIINKKKIDGKVYTNVILDISL